MEANPAYHHSLRAQLWDLVGNHDLADRLASKVGRSGETDSRVYLRIEATLCTSGDHEAWDRQEDERLLLGWMDLRNFQVINATPEQTTSLSPGGSPASGDSGSVSDDVAQPLTPQSMSSDGNTQVACKRRKTVGGLRLSKHSPSNAVAGDTDISSESDIGASTNCPKPGNGGSHHARQCHIGTRFPQRRNPAKDCAMPVVQPAPAEKLVSTIWRQLHSPIELTLPSPHQEPEFDIRTGVSGEVFLAVNRLCMKYYNQNQASRALEMIVQAYWVECYESRIVSICLESPHYSTTEARMAALKEACNALGWQEKDLRNRMAIWRGYKAIKDSGGWASLVFAGTGVYRFCKYRMGFNEGLTTRLRQLSSSFELAADTLHPGWRDLLRVISQGGPRRYSGHPHEWVTVGTGPAVPLQSTYTHLQCSAEFRYHFMDECIVDRAVFGELDPRRMDALDPDFCQVCKGRQSDDIKLNCCSCFPTLFGGARYPVAVQVFHTSNGKNNGVIACCNFDRGTAIAEFVGLITDGVEGLDVMVGGSADRRYQIYQGQMGNFTRFINHSCRPNSQFQKFFWRGKERIIVVSRGVSAGSEITVDYSDHYWRQLNKNCLCDEPCCRFAAQV